MTTVSSGNTSEKNGWAVIMKVLLVCCAALIVVYPCVATAEVADSSATGFTVKISVPIQASPTEVYDRMVPNVGDWWDPEHTFSGDSHNLSIEEKPMGCFCEKLPNHGGVRHLEVVSFATGKTLVMSGGLGPLQSIAAAGSMTIQLSQIQNGTKLDLVYTVTGYLPAGMNTWAAPVDSVLKQQFTRLKGYVERNGIPQKPDAPKPNQPRQH